MMADVPSFRSSLNGFNRTDVLNYIKTVLDEKASLASQLSQAQSELGEYAAQIASLELKLNEAASDRESEETIGRTMTDARRFSDAMIDDARQKADDMLKNAADTADGLNVKLGELTEEAENASDDIVCALDEIRNKLYALQECLQDFSREVKESGEPAEPAEPEADAEEPPRESSAPQRITVRRVKH